MSYRKIFLIIISMIISSSILYGDNGDEMELFDEVKWKERVESIDSSLFYDPHYKDGEYFNPWMQLERKGLFTVLKWRYFSDKPEYTVEEENFLPEVKALSEDYINTHDNFISWIGHASVLIKASGNIFITDPVFGEIPFVKKRRTQSALTYDEAAKIAGSITVLITHNHYDHLDKNSIMSFPPDTEFIVPAGLGSEIKGMRGTGAIVREIDWWNNARINNLIITFLPAQHWSKRAFKDVNSSLWGSYIIDTGIKKIFLCGDTGYCTVYKEIAKHFPDIDYAFMSAGAFHPRWFMHSAHQDEAEAICGFLELKAKKLIPFHWGSFRLGDEPEGYPPLHIKNKFPDALIINHGEIIPLQ